MTASPPAPRRHDPQTFFSLDSNEYGRGVAFFDAIYGFSATLLIANLDAPPGEAWRSVDSLLASGFGSQLFGFALSFVVIVAFWRANVRLMRELSGLDGPTMTANLVAVGLVIVIPFTTQGISDPASSDFALPTALYALNIALASLAQIAVSWLGRIRGLERNPTTGVQRAAGLITAWLPPVVFGASIPIALRFGPEAGQWTWLSLAILLPIAGRFLPRTHAVRSQHNG
ncbi:DUF1211 domain-containing protein [Gordonia iterans]|jgi:uncharacterized membrane protein|uniref:DUF1211 domain-containing protein n=1 Tax=Gordonia iterans TaxID=1004901 RepID=A0A2S0KCQ1_9ACTN|nr:TMEM175 family protein [Gordonia iterans]AVL99458.1 DUF1211 domain-containing protein [Gordonia iterans]